MTDFDVDYQMFGKYMEAKGIDPSCPMCRQKNWAFISETSGYSYNSLAIHRERKDIFDANIANVVFLKCSNCGYLAHFLREHVMAWAVAQLNRGPSDA